MDISPTTTACLFLQGGASTQFATDPHEPHEEQGGRLHRQRLVVEEGVQGSEDLRRCPLRRLLRGRELQLRARRARLQLSDDADYVYICQNETIYGTVYHELPNTNGKPLVADVSSCFLSEPMDVSKYGSSTAAFRRTWARPA